MKQGASSLPPDIAAPPNQKVNASSLPPGVDAPPSKKVKRTDKPLPTELAALTLKDITKFSFQEELVPKSEEEKMVMVAVSVTVKDQSGKDVCHDLSKLTNAQLRNLTINVGFKGIG